MKVRYALAPGGFSYRTLFAGAGEARWTEVTAVRWSQSSKWFRLELRDGRVVRISVLMLGLDRFAGAALGGVSTEAIDRWRSGRPGLGAREDAEEPLAIFPTSRTTTSSPDSASRPHSTWKA